MWSRNSIKAAASSLQFPTLRIINPKKCWYVSQNFIAWWIQWDHIINADGANPNSPQILVLQMTYSGFVFEWPCSPGLIAGRLCRANGVISVTTSVVNWARKQPLRFQFNQVFWELASVDFILLENYSLLFEIPGRVRMFCQKMSPVRNSRQRIYSVGWYEQPCALRLVY